MDLVDTSVQVEIAQSLFKLQLKQMMIVELLNCLENNVMKKDEFNDQFTNSLKKQKTDLRAM